MQIKDEARERITNLATSLGVKIPGDISTVAWVLPILEALQFRIQELEHKVNVLDIASQDDVIGL